MRLFLFVILFCLSVGRAVAQNAQDDAAAAEFWAGTTRIAISDVRSELRPTLTNEERAIFDEISFRADPKVIFNGRATIEEGQRRISVASGVPFLMNVLGQATAVGFRGNVPCMQNYMVSSIKDAFNDMDPRTPPAQRRPIWKLSAYAQLEPICRGADQLIANDQEMQRAIGATTAIGTKIVILHEIAHQILHHAEWSPKQPLDDDDLDQSRRNEDSADRWALQRAVELREPVVLATPYLLIMAASGLNEITIEGELKSTHPAGARRALVILNTIEDEFKKLNAPPEMLDQVEELRRRLGTLVPQ